MIKNFTALFLLLISFCATAQHGKLSGTVSDTIALQKLTNTSIVLLKAKDSTLYKFTRSDPGGNFSFSNIDSGRYVLLITYPQYADFADYVLISDTSNINLGNINMILRANLLKDVIVRNVVGAIKLKGDTTEFTADSFRVQPNATVEDLLKKLPGIQIDKNGAITAQGEKVKKILVDGEEFFGDDPTLVTQNLRADMIDKVQLYDKKSDQAAFTGIDDGQKEKTINLKLKDSKKNGYFGKLNASGGTHGFHDNQLMFNDFKNKRKIAIYGIISNTGTSGLNWKDQSSYGDNPFANADVDEQGGINIIFNGDDQLDSWDGRYNGSGVPLVQTGGLHFNNKWNDDKQSINGNYKILQLHVNGESATRSEYILPDTLYFNNDNQVFHNQILRNRINGAYEYQLDSMQSIKITVDGGIDHKITSLFDSSEARAEDSSLVNNALRKTSTVGDNKTLNANFLYRKKFKKRGRTISLNMNESFKDNASSGFLYSNNNFYLKSALVRDTLTDQFKNNETKSNAITSRITYTEPLSNISSLSINYGLAVNNSSSVINSFNKNSNQKYTELDSLYSNHYLFNILTNSGGIGYNLFKKKFKFNTGTDVGYSSFHQTNKFNDSVSNRNFVNWYPHANASYQFTQFKRLSIEYQGQTQQPDINQLQPVLTNTDPLNITIGNPALKPAFQNYMNLYFSGFKPLSGQSIFVAVNSALAGNAIVNKFYVDSFGRAVNQYVNLNGNRSLGINLNYGFKLKKADININLSSDINFNRYVNIVNNLFNVTQSGGYGFGLGFYKEKERKYSFGLNSSATYTSGKSSIQQGVKTNYWMYDANPSVMIYLKHKFQINTDCDFNFKQNTDVFNQQTNVISWNAWIGKSFTKKDALLIKIVGHDLLNQNLAFNRTVTSNFISEDTHTTIKRYFLLSVVWNFNKAGAKAPGGEQ